MIYNWAEVQNFETVLDKDAAEYPSFEISAILTFELMSKQPDASRSLADPLNRLKEQTFDITSLHSLLLPT